MSKKKLTPEKYRRRELCWNIIAWFFVLASWGILVWVSYRFYNVFNTFPMFPAKWYKWCKWALIGITVFMAIWTFLPWIKRWGKRITGAINLILSVCLLFGSVYLPSIRTSIEEVFTDVPVAGELEINFYSLIHPAHEDEEGNIIVDTEVFNSENLADYVDKTFIVVPKMDKENQDYALLVMQRELLVENVNTLEAEDLWQALDYLNSGKGDVLVLNSSYLPVIKNVGEYADFEEKTQIIYTVNKKLEIATTTSDYTSTPFVIYVGGNDDHGEIYLDGRTDVNLLICVNPNTKQVMAVSIPRDSYIPNPALWYNYDKLTHMGVSGINNTIEALSNYLDIPVDEYVVVNFSSFISIVNAMDGIDVYNPYEFEADSIAEWKGILPEGMIHMDGKIALAYVRERYNLPNGDFDRNMHQQIVFKAMVEKMTRASVITQVDKILKAMNGMFITTLSMDEIYAICQMQLDDMAVWDVLMYSVGGVIGSDICASMPSMELSVVYPDLDQVAIVKEEIQKFLNGEKLEQRSLVPEEEEEVQQY